MNEFSKVSITPDAADKCAEACRRFSDGLSDVRSLVQSHGYHQGFGIFPSGQALNKKYADLTAGAPGSLEDILQQHIDVATRLAEAFRLAGRRYAEGDDEAARSIANHPH